MNNLKHMFKNLLEESHQDASNEYQDHIFFLINKEKKIDPDTSLIWGCREKNWAVDIDLLAANTLKPLYWNKPM